MKIHLTATDLESILRARFGTDAEFELLLSDDMEAWKSKWQVGTEDPYEAMRPPQQLGYRFSVKGAQRMMALVSVFDMDDDGDRRISERKIERRKNRVFRSSQNQTKEVGI